MSRQIENYTGSNIADKIKEVEKENDLGEALSATLVKEFSEKDPKLYKNFLRIDGDLSIEIVALVGSQ